MDGKKPFKKITSPDKLFPLPTDPKPKVVSGKQAKDLLDSITK